MFVLAHAQADYWWKIERHISDCIFPSIPPSQPTTPTSNWWKSTRLPRPNVNNHLGRAEVDKGNNLSETNSAIVVLSTRKRGIWGCWLEPLFAWDCQELTTMRWYISSFKRKSSTGDTIGFRLGLFWGPWKVVVNVNVPSILLGTYDHLSQSIFNLWTATAFYWCYDVALVNDNCKSNSELQNCNRDNNNIKTKAKLVESTA